MAIGLGAAAVSAQDESVESSRQRWESMSREDRARIIEAYHKWKNLDENRRSAIRMRYEQFRALPEEEKLNVAINVRRFCAMCPEKRRRIREHLHAAPERWGRQLAFMRVASLVRENAGTGMLTREAVFREFMKMEYGTLSETFYPALPDERKHEIDAIENDARRFWKLREWAIDGIKRELEDNPPPDLPPADAPEYGRRLHESAVRAYYGRLVEQLPPSMAEMSLVIRAHAQTCLPSEQVLDLVETLKNGGSPESCSEKLNAMLKTEEMAQVIAEMPGKMRERFQSDEFGEAKRRQVVEMAFKPLNEIRPEAMRSFFGPPHPPGRRHPGPHQPDSDRLDKNEPPRHRYRP